MKLGEVTIILPEYLQAELWHASLRLCFLSTPTAATSIPHFNYPVPPVWVIRAIWKQQLSSVNLQLHFIAKLNSASISWLFLFGNLLGQIPQKQTSTALPLVQAGNSTNTFFDVPSCNWQQPIAPNHFPENGSNPFGWCDFECSS